MAICRAVLLAVLLLAPLGFGAVEPWCWGGMAVLVSGVVSLWAVGCAATKRVTLIVSPLYIPLLLLGTLAAVQLAAGLSADPAGTREALLKLVLGVLVFFLTQHLLVDGPPRLWIGVAKVVCVYTLLMAAFAIVQFLVVPEMLYGVIRPQWGGSVMGPYVNHNHYAGLMEMLLPITAALTIGPLAGQRHRTLPLLAAFMAFVSVVLCGSRGGLIAVVLECAAFASAVAYVRRSEHHPFLVLGACALCLIGAALLVWADPGGIWRRWEVVTRSPEVALDLRVNTTPDALRMARAHLSSGVGIGAFETAYPRYQTLVTDRVVDFAHNDYVQLAAEAGLPGCILAPVSIVAFLWLSFRQLGERLLSPVGRLQLGAALGVCGVLVHSFSDFNLHVPANGAWFAACAALATVPSDLSTTPCGPDTYACASGRGIAR